MSLLLLQDGRGDLAKQLHSFDKAKKKIRTAKPPRGRAQVNRIMLPSSLVLLPTSQQPAANQSSKAAEKETARHRDRQHAPSTACKAVLHQKVTPLTEPAHRQTSPSTSTDSTDCWSSSSSDAASSYQPSQESAADGGSPELHDLTVKPNSLLSRHVSGKSCRHAGHKEPQRATKQCPSASYTDKADDHKADTHGPLNTAVQGSPKVVKSVLFNDWL